MFEHEQVAVEGYVQQRARYRHENHMRVRRREGLPEHDGERYVVGGSRSGLVVGDRRGVGVGAGLTLDSGFERAGRDGEFELFVADPFDLAKEVLDLERDLELVGKSEAVRHEGKLPRGFDVSMHDEVLGDEVELLAWTKNVNEGLSK